MSKVVAKEYCRVSPDGGTTFTYNKGDEIYPPHAEWMLEKGLAKKLAAKRKAKDAGAAPENKAQET